MAVQCTYTQRDGDKNIECKRIIDSGQLCILHDNRGTKDLQEFENELRKSIKDPHNSNIDFRGTVFIGGYELFNQQLFQKKVLFDFAEFLVGVPSFKKIKFKQELSFKHVTFREGVIFEECEFFVAAEFQDAVFERARVLFDQVHFHKKANFASSIFQSNAIFTNRCIFHQVADFSGIDVRNHFLISNATFGSDLLFDESKIQSSVALEQVILKGRNSFKVRELNSNTFRFDGVLFLGRTEFDLTKFNSIPPSFIRCDLKEVRFLQLFNVDQFDDLSKPYIEQCKWARKKYWIISGRKIVADEKYKADQHKLLKLYRYLHKKFYIDSNYQLATEFYVGFMIQKRKLQTREWLAKRLDEFYSLFSRYGESINRPFWALVLMWFLVPILLLQLGIKLEAPNLPETKFPNVNLSDYFRTVSLNLQLSTLVRSSELRPPITSWQSTILFFETVLNGLFLGFFALGIRRRTVPRKPIE